MTTEITGSHLKAKNGYGQNGATDASSLLPGQTKPYIPDASPPSASAAPGDWQTRKVSAEPIKPSTGMEHNGVGGSPSGDVPAKLSR